MNATILFTLGASICVTAPAFSQANNIMEITVRRHANSTDGGAAAKFAQASLDLQNVDACNDTACCVTLMQLGATQVFGTSGDGLDVVTSTAELNTVFAAPGHCKVIISGSNSCGTGGGWLGCAQLGMRNMVVVSSAPACVWGHEFGHTQGLNHNQACFDLIMHATNLNVEAVQPFECTAFRANPDSTGPACGPGGGPANDNCSSATNLGSVLGNSTFDNTNATTDGLADALCDSFGTQQIDNDVWYRWTAPCNGDYTISTVGLTAVDTKIAAYADQACPPSGALACNDDAAGGLQSSISLPGLSGGSSILIRIGTFPSASGGTGSFNISRAGGPCPTGPPNDSCSLASAISGVGTFPFNTVGATTDGVPNAACNMFGSSQIENDVWFRWTVPAGGNYRIDTCGLTGLDTKIAIYGGTACPSGTVILDCNDDTCGVQSEVNVAGLIAGQVLLLRVGSFDPAATGAGSFRITQTGRPTGPLGSSYCIAAPNSVGPGALISAVGSRFVADNDFTLNTSGLPPGVFGLYYFGGNTNQVAFGEGFRCVALPTFRIQPVMPATGAGTFSRVIDLSAPPSLGVALPGVTLNYQHWYRDPSGGPSGFNLSNGLAIGWL